MSTHVSDDEVAVTVDARIRLDVEVDHHHDGRLVPMVEIDREPDAPLDDAVTRVAAEVRYSCPECSQVTTLRTIVHSAVDPSLELTTGSA